MWEELKNLREGQCLSLPKLAHVSGIPVATIATWENEMPNSVKRILALAEALNVTPNALLGHKSDDLSNLPSGSTVIMPECPFDEAELSFMQRAVSEMEGSYRDRIAEGEISYSDVDQINFLVRLGNKIEKLRGGTPE